MSPAHDTDPAAAARGERVQNRSVPTDTLLPHLVYEDVAAASRWLTETFGFAEHYRYGDAPVQGAQLRYGTAWFMLERARDGRLPPAQGGNAAQYLTLFVADVAQHYERVCATGATIVEELNETVYGERQYGVQDLGGHRWLFSQHLHDLAPESWGALVATR